MCRGENKISQAHLELKFSTPKDDQRESTYEYQEENEIPREVASCDVGASQQHADADENRDANESDPIEGFQEICSARACGVKQ
jgi:hypothetical protein